MAVIGVAAAACFGAMLLAIRPVDRAAANEADVRRYARLRTDANAMDAAALELALHKTREADAPEVEPLRDVAYNDVAAELGAPEHAVPLRWHQRLLAALA